MFRYMMNMYYFLLLFPAFSITQAVVGIHFQNRILWLPMGLLLLFLRWQGILKKFYLPLIAIFFYFVIYSFIAMLNNWNLMIYLGYVVTFLLLIVTCIFVEKDKLMFLKFFKVFFVCNIIYIIVQSIFLNLGMNSMSMIHSNLPAQGDYTIPVFITEPFFRFTGLFNESSPFSFYLSIAFCFFLSLGSRYERYKKISMLFLILSGSKFAYIFLVMHAIIFSRYKVVKILCGLLVIIFLYYFFIDFEYLRVLTGGQIASIIERLSGFYVNYDELGMWGNGLAKSSEGEIPLNMYAILANGFGYTSILIFVFIWLFYLFIKNENKKFFILPFFMGTLSNGSLLIFQYTLLVYCLVYLNDNYGENYEM